MGKAVLDVLQGGRPSRRPVWLMRQAGRYLPEYRAVRQQAGSFLDLCYNPAMAAEVTLQPLRRFDLDAAIVFADILLVPHALGCELSFVEHEGPLLSVVRGLSAVEKLGDGNRAWQFDRVYETLAEVRRGLAGHVALIGFCGAPWTVASYMIEGRSSDRQLAVRAAVENEVWFQLLMKKLIAVSVEYLCGQVDAGAEVLQIFDSWAGDLPHELRKTMVHDPIREVVLGVRERYPTVPVIVFARGIGEGHAMLARDVGASAVSVEQDCDLSSLLAMFAPGVAIQGNLAPGILLEGSEILESSVRQICQSVPKERHIFNLGHGILQQTPPESVSQLLEVVRRVDSVPV